MLCSLLNSSNLNSVWTFKIKPEKKAHMWNYWKKLPISVHLFAWNFKLYDNLTTKLRCQCHCFSWWSRAASSQMNGLHPVNTSAHFYTIDNLIEFKRIICMSVSGISVAVLKPYIHNIHVLTVNKLKDKLCHLGNAFSLYSHTKWIAAPVSPLPHCRENMNFHTIYPIVRSFLT